MEKLNDYFLNLLGNPTFSPLDFHLVGLSVDNTSLEDKSVYLGIDEIKNNKLFQTNGAFDLAKFDLVYNVAKEGYNHLANIKYSEELGLTWKFYKNNVTAPKELKEEGPEFRIEKVSNPLRLLQGFITFGLSEAPTMSVREIAETLKVWDEETNSWKESPNETWFDNFINPKVLALYDEDGFHTDPITGEKVEHKKGDKKLNANGTYYYETLNGRSPYGREVLSAFDTLTVDGSTLNSLDFFDSDDIDKSVGGSMARAVAQIAPALIPGLGEWYIGSRVLLSLTELIPVFGKAFSFNNDNKFLSLLEAYNKALSFSTSDYTQGSEELGIEGTTWSAETALKLIADVFTQLAEQRFLFKYGSSMFSKLSAKEISDPKKLEEFILKYIKDNANNEEIAKALEGSDLATKIATTQSINYARGKQILMKELEHAQLLGSKLSLAYMTGITTASAYGEAKEAGASDIEASLFTLGYTMAEYLLLNSDLGKWILPELKSDKRHWLAIVKNLQKETKGLPKETPVEKLKWYLKIVDCGKKIYHNEIGSTPVLGETFGAVVSNMMSEGVEETSEELLADLSKALFTAAFQLSGSKTDLKPFENVFDRYMMSFLGGGVGGGIAGFLPGYRAARFHNSMDNKVATKELVDIILLGKEREFLETAYKMTLNDKNKSSEVDEYGNSKEGTPTNNKDLDAKKRLSELVYNIKDILTANGADMSRNEVVNSLKGDLRYAQLSALASQNGNAIWYYLNKYNDLSSKLVSATSELYSLENDPIKTDKEKREEDKKGESSSEKLNKAELIKLKKEEIKNIKDLLQAYKDGRMSDEFIQDALFEMITGISSHYVATDPWRWAEEKENKPYSEIPLERRAELLKEFEELKKNITNRELMHKARLVHIKNLEYLADMLENFDKEYFKNKGAIIRNIEEILFGEESKIIMSLEGAADRADLLLHIYDNYINPILSIILRLLSIGLDSEKAKEVNEKLEKVVGMKESVKELLGRESMPSLEELKKLPSEEQEKIINAITRQLEEKASISLENFENYEKDLKEADTLLATERALTFNEQLRDFLQDPIIKKSIIEKLSSAKYILPTTKLALINFFSSLVKIYSEDDGEVISIPLLNESDLNEYLDSFKDKPSSPTDEFLSLIVATLRSKGINIPLTSSNVAKLLFDLGRAGNIESFNYDSDTELLINLALDVLDLAIVALESAKTSINGDLSDLFGFNATVNEIREKKGIKTRDGKATEETLKTPRKLATIDADIATLILLDINKYRTELKMYLAIYASNTQAVLNSHDNTYKVESYILYDRTKRFIGSVDIDDWKGIDDLRNLLESSAFDIFKKIKDDPELKMDDSVKEEVTKARITMELALHDFFNSNSDKLNDHESLRKLLKNIRPSRSESTWTLNENEKGIPESDYVWYLASLASANPESVLHEYKECFTPKFAPVAGLEEVIRTTYAFLLNPKIFENFAKAYNDNLPDPEGEDYAYLTINTFRSIFVEGLAGTGKSTATLTMILRMLDKYHPEILKKIVLVSNSKENSELLLKNLKESTGLTLDNVLVFSKHEYFTKISNNYPPLEELFDENGQLKITREDITYREETGNPIYSKITPNIEGLEASIVIIDEATSLSLLDAELEEDWLKAKGIYSIKLGDFDLLGVYGEYTGDNGKPVAVFLVGTNYIRSRKLGQIIRGDNEYKINNTLKFRENRNAFEKSLKSGESASEIMSFSYYEDLTGIYGDVVDTIGMSGDVSDDTKQRIITMLNTLKEKEKLNFIYDDKSSPLYEYLTTLNSSGKFTGKINLLTAGASQSLEGQYYIVDLNTPTELIETPKDKLTADQAFSAFYTAISRAKLATLVFDRTGEFSKRISSKRMSKLVKKLPSLLAIAGYLKKRKEILENVLGEYKPTPPPKKESTTEGPKGTPVEPPSNEKNEGIGKSDLDIDIQNLSLRRRPNITNEEKGKTNMMLHSTIVLETGCEVSDKNLDPTDPNNILRESPLSSKRIDNINGLIKIGHLGISFESDGTLSQKNKEKALEILGNIRNGAIYGENKAEVIEGVAKALGLNPDDVKVNFIYKNAYELDKVKTTSSSSNFMKFFKSIKERLLGIFNKDGDRDKLTAPHRQTIGIEVFIKEGENWKLKLEVPLVMLTSPLTMLNTPGYETLKYEFENNHHTITDASGKVITSLVESFTQWLWQHKDDPTYPHAKSMYKMFELYNNYNNFVVRFSDDFVLNDSNSELTGIIHAQKRGEEYFFTHAYDYKGKPVSLEEYRKRMPWRTISEIRANNTKKDYIVNGVVIAKSGDPFVLISDDPKFKNATFDFLMLQYIKQAKDESEPERVKRMYLYTPEGSIEDFLYNMERALTKDEDDDVIVNEIDTKLGNKLSAYRLLLFISREGSNFDLNFKERINEITDVNEESKQNSIKKWEKLKQLMEKLKEIEDSFDLRNGTKANQLLELLDKPIENLPAELKTIATSSELGWPKSTLKFHTPLRTILLYEFRKLLYSPTVYGPSLGTLSVPPLTRTAEGVVEFADYQKPRIESLLKDAYDNNYTGVKYYVSLKEASENINVEGMSFARVNAEGDVRISKRPIEINGKLETTAVIRDVEPILDEIIRKGIPNGNSSIGVSKLNTYSTTERKKQYEENTQAYVNGVITIKNETPEETFRKNLVNSLTFSSEITNSEQSTIKRKIEERITELMNSPEENLHELLLSILIPEKHIVTKVGNKWSIRSYKNIEEYQRLSDSKILFLDNNEALGIILGNTVSPLVQNIGVLESYLPMVENERIKEVIQNKIQELKKPVEEIIIIEPTQVFKNEYLTGIENWDDFSSLLYNFISSLESSLSTVNPSGEQELNLVRTLAIFLREGVDNYDTLPEGYSFEDGFYEEFGLEGSEEQLKTFITSLGELLNSQMACNVKAKI